MSYLYSLLIISALFHGAASQNYVLSSSWSLWSPWSFCSNNVMVRVRACSTVRGFKCIGHNKEFQSCDSSRASSPDHVDAEAEDRELAMKQLYHDYDPPAEEPIRPVATRKPLQPPPRKPLVVEQHATLFPQPPSTEELIIAPPSVQEFERKPEKPTTEKPNHTTKATPKATTTKRPTPPTTTPDDLSSQSASDEEFLNLDLKREVPTIPPSRPIHKESKELPSLVPMSQKSVERDIEDASIGEDMFDNSLESGEADVRSKWSPKVVVETTRAPAPTTSRPKPTKAVPVMTTTPKMTTTTTETLVADPQEAFEEFSQEFTSRPRARTHGISTARTEPIKPGALEEFVDDEKAKETFAPQDQTDPLNSLDEDGEEGKGFVSSATLINELKNKYVPFEPTGLFSTEQDMVNAPMPEEPKVTIEVVPPEEMTSRRTRPHRRTTTTTTTTASPPTDRMAKIVGLSYNPAPPPSAPIANLNIAEQTEVQDRTTMASTGIPSLGKTSREEKMRMLNERARVKAIRVFERADDNEATTSEPKLETTSKTTVELVTPATMAVAHSGEVHAGEVQSTTEGSKTNELDENAPVPPLFGDANDPDDFMDFDTAKALSWMIANMTQMVEDADGNSGPASVPADANGPTPPVLHTDPSADASMIPLSADAVMRPPGYESTASVQIQPRKAGKKLRRRKIKWSSWSLWSECNCGQQTRRRVCIPRKPKTESGTTTMLASFRAKRATGCPAPQVETRSCLSTSCNE